MTSHDIQTLFETGAHFGYTRSRRHPSAEKFIFAAKDRNDIFDLEKTEQLLADAQKFSASIASSGKQILFVAGKHEAVHPVKEIAESVGQPYVAGRWIGGTLTNFKEIRKRIDRLEKLRKGRDSGEHEEKYTKLERLMIDREITDLEDKFGGLVHMRDLPAALFVVDPRHESTAVNEAHALDIPIVALASSDCDFGALEHPIPANDSSVKSIRFFTECIAKAYEDNKKAVADKKKEE